MRPLGALVAAFLAAAVVVPLSPARAAAEPTCQGERATIVGTPEDDDLVGTAGPDVIVGLGGDDTVDGRGGDDLVCGGAQADTLRGGAGDDRLYGQRDRVHSDRGGIWFDGDVLEGGPGDDLLDIGADDRYDLSSYSTLDYQHARSGVTVDLAAGTATGEGNDTLVPAGGTVVLGSRYDDTLLGSDAGDDLYGKAGADHLDGRGGNDELIPDARRAHAPSADDVAVGGPGDDFIYSWDGRDQLFGDDGFDQIWALEGGPFELYGGDGPDRLVVVFSSHQGFVIDGGPGLDNGQFEAPRSAEDRPMPRSATVTMADGAVVANGAEWGRVLNIEDLRLGGPPRWEYLGTDAPETVSGGWKRLRATTYGGDDTIVGTPGPDRIDAGDGDDTVWAGGGRDLCWDVEERHSCQERTSPSARR